MTGYAETIELPSPPRDGDAGRRGRFRSPTRALGLASARGALLGSAPFVLALVIYVGAFAASQPGTTGDEPHYLIYAHSLAFDGDVDLRNNYEGDEVSLYYGHPELLAHVHRDRPDGKLTSAHYIGLPIVMAPVLFLGGGLLGARLELIVISALMAHQLFRLLEETRIAGGALLWSAWAAVVFSLPIVIFSSQVYPEMPAALVVVYGVRTLLARAPSLGALTLASLGAAVLPWLHIRFALFAAGLALGVAYRLLRPEIRRSGGLRALAAIPRPDRRARLLALAPVAISVALHPLGHAYLHGAALPADSASRFVEGGAHIAVQFLYRFGLGAVLSPAVGWLPYAPVHWVGVVGLGAVALRFRWKALAAFAFIGPYLWLVGTVVSAGHSPPARYLIVLMPLIAIPLLLVITISRPMRIAFIPLFGFSLALLAAGVVYQPRLYPQPDGRAALPILVTVQDVWPSFDIPPRSPDTVVFEAKDLGRLVGQLAEPVAGQRQAASMVAHALPGRDAPGVLSYGPYASLDAGRYVARFELSARGDRPNTRVADIDVMRGSDLVLARQTVRLADVSQGQGSAALELPFTVLDGERIQTRVHYTGQAEVWFRGVEVTRLSPPPPPPERFPSWPQSLLWVFGTVLVGALLLPPGRRSLAESAP